MKHRPVGLLLKMGVAAVTLWIANAEDGPAPIKGYPKEVVEIHYPVPEDGSRQQSLYWRPGDRHPDEKVPLLIGLHTWSGNHRQAGGEAKYAEWCVKNRWIFMHPNFRGANKTKESMGSDLVVADIRAAVAWAKKQGGVDEDRIYVVGVSGGSHAAQLVAGRLPGIWAGVSAWCGISDLNAWHAECLAAGRKRYAMDIEQALGGSPSSSVEREARARYQSPVAWLKHATRVPLDLNHGLHDGRKGSVPFTHSLHAWNAVVPESKQLEPSFIETFYTKRDAGEEAVDDPLYVGRPIRFRRIHANVRLTIFEGGHEILHLAALNWLTAQRRGQPAVWNPPKVSGLEIGEADSASGK